MAEQSRRRAHPWYVVGLCTVAFFFSYTDRQVVSLLVEPIKADLGLNDTQFGLLQGLAFSLFYAVMGLPVATASDRVSRPLIISIGVAVWSAATVGCGLAVNFAQMLAGRLFVGAGEAALSPATYALISDIFPRDRIGRATAVYSLGSFFGAGFAYLVGGAAIGALERHGALMFAGHLWEPWRVVMIMVGLPGLLLALVIGLTVPEPTLRGARAPDRTRTSTKAVMIFLGSQRRVFGPHILGYSMSAMALFALLSWSPAYLMRLHGFSTQTAGLWLGSLAVLASGAGVLISGVLLDQRTRNGQFDGPFGVGVIGALGVAAAMAGLAVASSPGAALTALGFAYFFASFPMAPSAAVIQTVAPADMRSRISAIFLFFNSFIGLALGALLVGLLNDRLFGGPMGLRQSLPLVGFVAAVLAAGILWRGMGPYSRTMANQAHVTGSVNGLVGANTSS